MKILFFWVLYQVSSTMIAAQTIVINNTRTAAHIPLPKSKLSLVPPANYDLLPNDTGFYLHGSNPEKGDEQIKVVKFFLDFSVVKQGLLNSVSGHTDVLINNYEGVWIKTRDTAGGQVFTSLTLGFGNSSYSYVIVGIFPSENATIEKKLQKAIQSAYVDTFGYSGSLNKARNVNKVFTAARQTFETKFASRFKVDITGTGFMLAEVISDDHLVYTLDGAYPPVNPDKSKIEIKYSSGTVSEGSYITYSNQVLGTNPDLHSTSDVSTSSIEINGLKGTELMGKAIYTATSVPVKVYQLTLFDAHGVYSITGISYKATDEMIGVFKSIAKTFTRTL